jgi:hypothetical protein
MNELESRIGAAGIDSGNDTTPDAASNGELVSETIVKGFTDLTASQPRAESIEYKSSAATPPTTLPPNVVTLDVGGRKFKTSLMTLTTKSGFFKAFFGENWATTPQPDGSYFVDADPSLFEHLLAYMRRPNVYPVFWSKTAGFDHALYHRLACEAEFFQLYPLSDWIGKQGYLQGVSIQVEAPTRLRMDLVESKPISSNAENSRQFLSRIERTYICPRGIFVHRGEPGKCGIACAKARGGAEVEYEENKVYDVTDTMTHVQFNGKAYKV